MRRLALIVFAVAAGVWIILITLAIRDPESEPHGPGDMSPAAQARTLALVVAFIAGSVAFPRRRWTGVCSSAQGRGEETLEAGGQFDHLGLRPRGAGRKLVPIGTSFLDAPSAHGREGPTFVVDENLNRRHMTTSEKGLAAARLLPELAKEAMARMKAGVRLDPGPNWGQGPSGRTAHRAAQMFGVGFGTVERARRVLTAPDLLEKVEKGEMTVSVSDAYRSSIGSSHRL